MTFTSLFELWLAAGPFILAGATLLWLISLLLRDASIVDVAWGLAFVAVAWWAQIHVGFDPSARALLMLALVTLWGVRLGGYLGLRRWGQPEDKRYRRWRDEAGPAWWWQSYFKVFLLQGGLLWLISAPLLAVALDQGGPLGWLDGLATLLWLVGFGFETAADWQLARFKANPVNAGKTLTSGVWRYSRHPNYFGEAVQWWGFYLIALAAGAWFTVFSPLLMTYLLLKVSGVPMLEGDLKQSKRGYSEYVRRTPAFVPWFPRDAEGSGRSSGPV